MPDNSGIDVGEPSQSPFAPAKVAEAVFNSATPRGFTQWIACPAAATFGGAKGDIEAKSGGGSPGKISFCRRLERPGPHLSN